MFLKTDNTIYTAIYHGARAFAQTFGTLEIVGWEHLPEGGCVVACNHQSMIDPPIVGGSLNRELAFFARKTLFANPVFAKVLEACNTIPVDRDGGTDVAAFKKVFATIKSGRGLILFPEGTRSPDGRLQEPKGGPGLIACRMKAPVVPIRIFGARDILPRGAKIPRAGARVSVVIGRPLSPAEFDPGAKHPDQAHEASRRIMAAIAALREPPQSVA